MMTKEDRVKQFEDTVITAGLKALETPDDKLEATDERSEVRISAFQYNGEDYKAIEQNTKKDSKFARLALNGHHVVWIIRHVDGDWFLSVDGKWILKSNITDEGNLVAA